MPRGASTPRATCSASPPGSTRSSSASRRSSGRSRPPTRPSSDLHCTGTITHRLFHAAFAVGKRVRSETGLGEGAVSVSYAAIALARKIFGDLSGLSVAHPRRRRDGEADRRAPAGAAGQADHHREPDAGVGGGPGARSSTAAPCRGARSTAALAAADIVVTATGATEPVLTRAMVEEAMRPRRNRPLFIIDIARAARRRARGRRPRAGLPLQHRRPADDREARTSRGAARSSRAPRRSSTRKSRRFAAWLQSREIVPTVVALRQRFEQIRQVGAAAARAEAGRPAAGGARARRRDHAADRREAAAHADRAAEDGRRRRHRDRVRGRAEPAVRSGAAGRRR